MKIIDKNNVRILIKDNISDEQLNYYCKPLYFLDIIENVDNLSEHLCIFSFVNYGK